MLQPHNCCKESVEVHYGAVADAQLAPSVAGLTEIGGESPIAH